MTPSCIEAGAWGLVPGVCYLLVVWCLDTITTPRQSIPVVSPTSNETRKVLSSFQVPLDKTTHALFKQIIIIKNLH